MVAKRDSFFDNVKFVLIILVVLGHGMEVFDHPFFANLYTFIYVFHMPAFILVTGYFSKNTSTRGFFISLCQYIVFQCLYILFRNAFLGASNALQFTTPYWLMWFSLSTLLWKLMAPFFKTLKHGILISIGIGLIVGFDATVGRTLSFSRSLVFFPFFMIGYHLKGSGIQAIKAKVPSVFGLIGMLLFGTGYMILQPFSSDLLYAANGYAALGYGPIEGVLLRLAMYGCALVGIALLFIMIPSKQSFVSTLGSRTVQAYLLHGFIILYLKHIEFGLLLNTPERIVLFLLSLSFITIILLTKPFSYLFLPIHKLSDFIFKVKVSHPSPENV